MLTKIEDLPETVIGFAISGTLSADDREDILLPALHEQEKTGPIELLLVTTREFLGTDVGSAAGSSQFRRSEPLNIRKLALVTTNMGFAQGVQMFGMLAHAEVKVFRELEDKDYIPEAVAWLRK